MSPVPTYNIFGRQVGSHILSMATLGTVGGGIWLSLRGRKKAPEDPAAINAATADEEQFIKYALFPAPSLLRPMPDPSTHPREEEAYGLRHYRDFLKAAEEAEAKPQKH
ncbi:MAG: hypothetical protein M1826_006014 [Phylliscum demangeonii]|nr:MAG: hypothetical protein M1826_006014 [Phylliscum demangeonii]